MKKGCFVVFLLLILGGLTSCQSAPDVGSKEASSYQVRLDFEYIPELFQGHYEAFIINGPDVISLGKFIVNNQGDMFNVKNNKKIKNNILKSEKDIKLYDNLIVTLEPDEDKNERPSESRILEAEVSQEFSEAFLTFQEIDLSNISGSFQLKTPTDQFANNETSGIWFEKNDGGKAVKGLKLAPTPAGWVYQGWVAREAQLISTGIFGDTYGKDWNNEYSGNEEGIQFPGEDFLTSAPERFNFPINLADGKSRVFITVEPWYGSSKPAGDNPFRFKILEKMIPKDAKPSENIKMQVIKEQIPRGRVIFL